MRVVLVGADWEENLGVGMIAAAALQAGHTVEIVAFNQPGDVASVRDQVLALEPDVVGLSVQFQHRAGEFMGLARLLREAGYSKHITCGGQFPTLAFEQVLDAAVGIDSVVMHEGEHSFPELLEAIAAGRSVTSVPGLAVLDDDGRPHRTGARRLADNLDDLPFPTRYRSHARHMGVPFVPIMGARGCWGSCAYCSITSYFRDAREHGGGRTLRWRSPENIAAEMALLAGETDGDAIFCFHDDTFLLPKAAESIARTRALVAALEPYGLGKLAMIAKCRPDSITPELARVLRDAGVIRLYVGVENASEHGAGDLGRASQWKHIHRALEACREAGIFVCYNLLIFEPDATIEDVRTNVRFIREHSDHPVNFCRAEPYVGTPLERSLSTRAAIAGSYLGWSYRITDPRVEVLFRVCAAAFRARNFAPDGVANRYMGLGYAQKILDFFYEDPDGSRASLARRVRDTTRGISRETAEFLTRAIDMVQAADLTDADLIERETALLGLEIAAADARWQSVLDELLGDMEAFATRSRRARSSLRIPRELLRAARQLAIGATLAASAACSRERPTMMPADPVPPPTMPDGAPRQIMMPADPVPMPMDPVPMPMRDASAVIMPADPVPGPPMVVDPPPPPGGSYRRPVARDAGTHPSRTRPHIMAPDPVPRHLPEQPFEKTSARLPVIVDQWRDTTPRAVERTDDLPLSSPPDVTLDASREAEWVLVSLRGAPTSIGTRWQSRGAIEGTGGEVRWRPASADDSLRVAVRTHGGVAIVSLRATEIC